MSFEKDTRLHEHLKKLNVSIRAIKQEHRGSRGQQIYVEGLRTRERLTREFRDSPDTARNALNIDDFLDLCQAYKKGVREEKRPEGEVLRELAAKYRLDEPILRDLITYHAQ